MKKIIFDCDNTMGMNGRPMDDGLTLLYLLGRSDEAEVLGICCNPGNGTPDEVYDNNPADRLMHDIALALMATQTQTTEVLDTFPTIPAVQEAEQILAEAENPEVTIPQEA